MPSRDFIDAFEGPYASLSARYEKELRAKSAMYRSAEELQEELERVSAAFEETTVNRYQRTYNTIAKILREKTTIRENQDELIRDMVQLASVEAFLKRLNPKWSNFASDTLLAFKTRDVINNFLRCYCNRKPPTHVELSYGYDVASTEPDPCERLELQEQAAYMQDGLNEKDRQLVELKMEKASSKKIAEQLGITVTNATTMSSRLMLRIQERLNALF